MSIADELLKIKELLDSGAINNEEYESLKKQLIGKSDIQSSENKVFNDYHIPVENFILENQSPKYKDKNYEVSVRTYIHKEFKDWFREHKDVAHGGKILFFGNDSKKKNDTFYHPYIINNVDCNNFVNFKFPNEYVKNILDSNFTKLAENERINFLVLSPISKVQKVYGLIFTNMRLIYDLQLLEGDLVRAEHTSKDSIELSKLGKLKMEGSAFGQSIPIHFGDRYIGSIDSVGIFKSRKDGHKDSQEKIREFLNVVYKSIKNE